MRQTARRQAGQAGQAAIETAFVIPVLMVIVIFSLGLSLLTTAQSELSAATSLAILGAATAPAKRGDIGMANANAAWNGTMARHHFLLPKPLAKTCAGTDSGPDGGYRPGETITCTGTAEVAFSRTPVATIWPFPNPTISTTVTARTSSYRATCPKTVC